IASGRSVYSVVGKEYVAVTAGGTPTSSNGGTVSQLQVFALGGSHTESPPPSNLPKRFVQSVPQGASYAFTPSASQQTVARPRHARAAAGAEPRITTQSAVVVKPWNANSSNTRLVFGHLYLGGAPVSGAVLRVDGYRLPEATGKRGGFSYRIDDTLPGRHQVRVVGTGHATVHGRKLTSGEAAAVRAASGGFSVGYQDQ